MKRNAMINGEEVTLIFISRLNIIMFLIILPYKQIMAKGQVGLFLSLPDIVQCFRVYVCGRGHLMPSYKSSGIVIYQISTLV